MKTKYQFYPKWRVLVVLAFLIPCFVIKVQAAGLNVLQQELQDPASNQLMFGQSEVAELEMVKKIYVSNDHRLLWQKPLMVKVLLEAIDTSYLLGLDPQDYHRDELVIRIKENPEPAGIRQAQLDILLTDALLRLAYHLNFGKVVPKTLDPDWNLRREFLVNDPVAKLAVALSSEDELGRFLEQSVDQGVVYKGLIYALAQYRQIAQEGGWEVIPSGVVLKPGMSDPRLPLLKARLQVGGDLGENEIDADDDHYNEFVEKGVRHFQQRHQLEVDGVIGRGTLEQMNISVEHRIEQIRANLERVRWVKRNLGDEFLMVNIAGYTVYYFKDNELVWKSRAQVGKDYRKTPVFRDDISYLVFNPTWTVPPTILAKDILPKLKKDPGYLQSKNMNVIDSSGNIIDSSQIDWSTMTPRTFPYMIRQESGPTNALGRVKFMFPNKHMVYLHDTPSKGNFERAERAFSSGCIRVENPFELVELLLKDSNEWNSARFDEILASGKLRNVKLPVKVPVLLLYFTAQLSEEGQVMFYKDIYHRDNKIIAGLKNPFHLVLPDPKID